MSLPFIIAGAGIGGLATALALARHGIASHVYERAAEMKEVGAGIQLGPNIFNALEHLGLAKAVADISFFPEALVMMDSMTGEEVTRVVLGDRFVERFGHRYAVAYRADLYAVLLRACRDETDLIRLETGCGIREYQDDGDTVFVHLEDGRKVQGAALIGADGLWSSVRGKLVGDGPPRVSGHIAYRAVLPVGEVPPDLLTETVKIWVGPKNHLVQYKLRRGELFNLVDVFHSDRYVEGWDAAADRDELMARFEGTRPEVQRLLNKIETWRMWILCDREPIRGWSQGRVTLLGDAAHPMLQYLAQGACMASEDAVCLAGHLAANRGDIVSAFTAYEAKRYRRTARVQITARYYGDVYHAAGVTRELRNEFLQGRDPENYDSVAWLYGH